jgi:hypothetical protein
LLYQDEKGPIAAKTYGGTSWSQVQSLVERAQKINNGILNVMYLEYMTIQMIKCIYIPTKTKQENSFSILSKG